jgi:hypothetical protein
VKNIKSTENCCREKMMKYGMKKTPSIAYKMLGYLLGMVLIVVAVGCTRTRTALPPDLFGTAKVAQMAGVRTWAFEHSPMFEEDLIESTKQELRYSSTGHDDASGHFNILALSGGGANGAFGAGILYGWSAARTRPIFKLVTGISTGALIAPFAFLGADYDQILKQVYTSTATKDILKFKPFIFTRRGLDSLADSSPLQRLIEKYGDSLKNMLPKM